THLCNLAHLCKRHHTLKHHTAWTVTQHPDGTLEWTSPTGRRYLDIPHGALEFTTTPATTTTTATAATGSGAPPPF
ncbi:HNH endonuclease, partial [Microbacterium sp. NPDC058021]